jgi:hypothetical protein
LLFDGRPPGLYRQRYESPAPKDGGGAEQRKKELDENKRKRSEKSRIIKFVEE